MIAGIEGINEVDDKAVDSSRVLPHLSRHSKSSLPAIDLLRMVA